VASRWISYMNYTKKHGSTNIKTRKTVRWRGFLRTPLYMLSFIPVKTFGPLRKWIKVS